MAYKKQNALRRHHLLIKRDVHGFVWQIRYGRNAKPLAESEEHYRNAKDAENVGLLVLAKFESVRNITE